MIPAAATTAGNGTWKKKSPANASAAMPHITPFLSAFFPMRTTAEATIAITAGFNP